MLNEKKQEPVITGSLTPEPVVKKEEVEKHLKNNILQQM